MHATVYTLTIVATLMVSLLAQGVLVHYVKQKKLHYGYSPLVGTWIAHVFVYNLCKLIVPLSVGRGNFFDIWGSFVQIHALLAVLGGMILYGRLRRRRSDAT